MQLKKSNLQFIILQYQYITNFRVTVLMKIIVNQPNSSSGIFLKTFSLQKSCEMPFQQFCHSNFFCSNQIIVCDFCQCDITLDPNVFVYETQDECPHQRTSKAKQYCWGCFAKVMKNVDYKQYGCYHARNSCNYSLTHEKWSVLHQILMLEAIQKYGLGNWSQISSALCQNRCPVRQKEVQQHYFNYYLDSEFFQPFLQPELLQVSESQFNWKSLLQKEYTQLQVQTKKQSDTQAYLNLALIQQESASSTKCQDEEETEYEQLIKAPIDQRKGRAENKNRKNRRSKNRKQNQKENMDIQRHPIDKYFKNYVPNINDSEYTYYLEQRQEFQYEFDPYAECLISDLQFNDETDSPEQRQLKLNLLLSYNQRLKERIKRRKFAVQHKFLDLTRAKQRKMKNIFPNISEQRNFIFPGTQKQFKTSIQQRMKPFTRFCSFQEMAECQNLMMNTMIYDSLLGEMQKLKKFQKITNVVQSVKKIFEVNNQGSNLKRKKKKSWTIYKKQTGSIDENLYVKLNKLLDDGTIQRTESAFQLFESIWKFNRKIESVQINEHIKIRPLSRAKQYV